MTPRNTSTDQWSPSASTAHRPIPFEPQHRQDLPCQRGLSCRLFKGKANVVVDDGLAKPK
jgi:hypothetical protein